MKEGTLTTFPGKIAKTRLSHFELEVFFTAETTARPAAGTKKRHRATDFTDYTDKRIEA